MKNTQGMLEDCKRRIKMTNEKMIEKLEAEGLCKLSDMEFIISALEENSKLEAEIERLKAELEQSVKLPCKVGDKLFSIENGYIEEFKVRSLNHIVNLIEFSRFDETVFFTREEAEQSLKGQVKE